MASVNENLKDLSGLRDLTNLVTELTETVNFMSAKYDGPRK